MTSDEQERRSLDTLRSPTSAAHNEEPARPPTASPRSRPPGLSSKDPMPRPNVAFSEQKWSPPVGGEGLSPAAADRVFPVRSVVSVDPTPTPASQAREQQQSYFGNAVHTRRSPSGMGDLLNQPPVRYRTEQGSHAESTDMRRQSSSSTADEPQRSNYDAPAQRPQQFATNESVAGSESAGSERGTASSDRPSLSRAASSVSRNSMDQP